ncbi:hypothetical protein D030_0324B, partial [Vibrio parahaemolyticus AQ3810]
GRGSFGGSTFSGVGFSRVGGGADTRLRLTELAGFPAGIANTLFSCETKRSAA